MLAHSGAIRCEVGFYRLVRPRLDFEVPFAFYANYDPESFNSIIVLEDLRGKGRFLDMAQHGSPDLMREQLSLLAKLHGGWAGSPDLDTDFAQLPTWEERFRGLMLVNLEQACQAGLEASRDLVPARLWDRRGEIWPATIASLQVQAALPRGLAHGDVHLHNWYRRNDGVLGLGDWGVTHRGHWSRDLGYCLAAGLSVDDRRSHEDNLLRHYVAEFEAAGGPSVTLDEAREACRHAIMTALAFWTMTVAPVAEMPDMQPLDTARSFTERLAAAVDDWDSLDFF
jgi:aminoglycoside phosphotransferase (APT) family kinase protein